MLEQKAIVAVIKTRIPVQIHFFPAGQRLGFSCSSSWIDWSVGMGSLASISTRGAGKFAMFMAAMNERANSGSRDAG